MHTAFRTSVSSVTPALHAAKSVRAVSEQNVCFRACAAPVREHTVRSVMLAVSRARRLVIRMALMASLLGRYRWATCLTPAGRSESEDGATSTARRGEARAQASDKEGASQGR